MTSLRFIVCAALVAGATTGCAASNPVNLYVLEARMPLTGEHLAGPIVALDPVELPAYLARPQIVTRASANRVRAAEFERWAEPLDQGVTRVLAENLAHLLPSDRVAVGSWQQGSGYRVSVKIGRFDGNLGGVVVLIANWSITGPGGQVVRAGARSIVEQPAGTPTYEATADAMSGALARLADEMAIAIREGERSR